MWRLITFFWLGGFTTICFAQDKIGGLPGPHYHPQGDDPGWLKNAVQLHGHLGPMLTCGARMGMAALRAVDAKGYFDVEVTCEGPFANPPASCFLDGIQIATGATLGKRNLKWIDSEKIVVRIENTKTGKTACLQPSKKILALLPQPQPTDNTDSQSSQKAKGDDDHLLDGLARQIATMPEKDIVVIGE